MTGPEKDSTVNKIAQ